MEQDTTGHLKQGLATLTWDACLQNLLQVVLVLKDPQNQGRYL